jgi:glycosyltransferase involved in cell wall biosynthesis
MTDQSAPPSVDPAADPAADPSGGPPAVSVVIPAYNRAATIRAAVESVLRQSFADLELIVVDDGSADGTMAALDGIADPRLRRLAHPHNRGVSAARNTGIRAARAPWVAFQDSDDVWLPDKLERQMARLAAADPATVACYCGMAIIEPNATYGRTRLRYHPGSVDTVVEGDISASILAHSLVSTQTLVARRDALEAIGGFDEALPALVDWDCAIRLARCGPFAFIDAPLVHQMFSDNSITRSRAKRAEARRRLCEKHAALYAGRPALLARHWVRVAGDFRALGDRKAARAALARARALRPLDPAIRLRMLRLLLPGGQGG